MAQDRYDSICDFHRVVRLGTVIIIVVGLITVVLLPLVDRGSLPRRLAMANLGYIALLLLGLIVFIRMCDMTWTIRPKE